jgi:nucleoside-diphosphate-sugar epimerase
MRRTQAGSLALPDAAYDLRGRRVLVAGGGFVGSRLAEILVADCAAEVVVAVRRPESIGRLAHLPCEVVVADVTDRARMADAMAGCDAVFNCAYGTSGSRRHRGFVNKEGTRRVLCAAGDAGVRRVVHLSTFMVYGRTAPGDITESAPRRRFGTGYADTKLAAERIALDLARRGKAPAVVLQPTNVYGPRAGVWAEDVVRKLLSGRIPLLDGGSGLCNHVYVDDLVQAMLLAAVTNGVVGEALIISSSEPATWREFYGRFEEMLGVDDSTVTMSVAEATERWRQAVPPLHTELLAGVRRRRLDVRRLLSTREARALRTTASSALPESINERIRRYRRRSSKAGAGTPLQAAERAVHLMTPAEIAFFSSRTRARIDKAERMLGYRPAVDIEKGMRLTGDWLADADLIPLSRRP